MDKFNVIIPTNDLNKLEVDMAEWIRLPYKLRKLSNDACLRQYNCTVNDLYTKLKMNILNKHDEKDVEPDNLVVVNTESWDDKFADEVGFYDYSGFADPEDFSNYPHLLQISNMLQQNSNIVIIDPNIHDLDALNAKYDSYNHLIQKFKTFSNDYSIQLWGYNVPNMYNKMMAKIKTKDTNVADDNVLLQSSFDEANAPLNNIMTTLLASCAVEKGNSLPEYFTEEKLEISIPGIVPWFTVSEMNGLGIRFSYTDPTTYIKALKEANTDEELLNLGWNPSVIPDQKGFERANARQRIWFNENDDTVYNLKDTMIDPANTVKSIFLFIKDPIPNTKDLITRPNDFVSNHYTKYAIGIDNLIYAPDDNGIYQPTSLDDYDNFEIIMVLIDNDYYDIIKSKISGFDANTPNAGNLFKYIFNRSDKLDRTQEKLVYSYILSQLSSMIKPSKDSSEFFWKGFYRIFKGTREEYGADKVKNIFKTIEKYHH